MGLQQKLERALVKRLALIERVNAVERADDLVAGVAALALSRRCKLGVVLACYGAAVRAVDDWQRIRDPVRTSIKAIARTFEETNPADVPFDPSDVQKLSRTEAFLKGIAELGRADLGPLETPEPAPATRADAQLSCARHLMFVAEGGLDHARAVVTSAARAMAWPNVSTEGPLTDLIDELRPVLTRGGLSILVSDLMWLKLEGHGPRDLLAMVERTLQH